MPRFTASGKNAYQQRLSGVLSTGLGYVSRPRAARAECQLRSSRTLEFRNYLKLRPPQVAVRMHFRDTVRE